jgi:hypothetical protein
MRNLLVLIACIAALAGDAAAHRSNSNNVKLQIYSNWPDPRTLLGCLNCAAIDPTSIWNPTSRYGWSNPNGVWSRPAFRNINYRHLVCDVTPRASPPAVFDQLWSFYYVLNVDATRRGGICALNMSQQGCAAVRALCAGSSVAAAPTVGWTDVVVP